MVDLCRNFSTEWEYVYSSVNATIELKQQKITDGTTIDYPMNEQIKSHLDNYTKEQLDNWTTSKIVIYENAEQLDLFIEESISGLKLDRKLYFGMISDEIAAKIYCATGLSLNRYNCAIRPSEIRKVLKSHGNPIVEANRGQRAITNSDFRNIPIIVSEADEIRLSPKLFQGKAVIEFVKTIEGKTTVVSYISNKHYDLTVQTMYASNEKENLATVADAKPLP